MRNSDDKDVLAIRCPTCGAKPGEKCALNTGQPRNTPHRDRCLASLGDVSESLYSDPLEGLGVYALTRDLGSN